jgi:hypothetical protein
VRWLVTASGRRWRLRGCRQDGVGQGSCLHSSGSDSAVGARRALLCARTCTHHALGRWTVLCLAGARRRWSGGVRGPGSGGHGWRALGCAQCLRGRGEGSAVSVRACRADRLDDPRTRSCTTRLLPARNPANAAYTGSILDFSRSTCTHRLHRCIIRTHHSCDPPATSYHTQYAPADLTKPFRSLGFS